MDWSEAVKCLLGAQKDFKMSMKYILIEGEYQFYVSMNQKMIIPVSSLHNDNSIHPNSKESNKPSMNIFYSETKGGMNNAELMFIMQLEIP